MTAMMMMDNVVLSGNDAGSGPKTGGVLVVKVEEKVDGKGKKTREVGDREKILFEDGNVVLVCSLAPSSSMCFRSRYGRRDGGSAGALPALYPGELLPSIRT